MLFVCVRNKRATTHRAFRTKHSRSSYYTFAITIVTIITTTMSCPKRIHLCPFLKMRELRLGAYQSAVVLLCCSDKQPPSSSAWEQCKSIACVTTYGCGGFQLKLRLKEQPFSEMSPFPAQRIKRDEGDQAFAQKGLLPLPLPPHQPNSVTWQTWCQRDRRIFFPQGWYYEKAQQVF